eukprot:jgi/Ulvmu1/1822/UM119_0040.1
MPRQTRWPNCLTARILAHARPNAGRAIAQGSDDVARKGAYTRIRRQTRGFLREDLVTRTAHMSSRAGPNLVVDTLDSKGSPVVPERIRAIMPRVKSFLDGHWQLSVTEDDIAARECLHAHAVELSDAWMHSPGDKSMDDTALFSHWQAHHQHTCPQGDMWHAQWVSLSRSHHLDAWPRSLQVNDVADHDRREQSSYSVRRMPKKHHMTMLQCHVGLVPPSYAEGMDASPLASWQFSVPADTSFSCGDTSSDSWESFLVLLSQNASFLIEENMFPNKMQHGDRVLHCMTLQKAVQFIANPTVSEITRHIYNTQTHGADAQLQRIVDRWGIKTLSALREFHDDAAERGSIGHVCAHARNLG